MLKQQIQQPPPQSQQHQLLPNLDMISPVNQSSLTYFDDVDHSLSMINFLNVVLILRLSIEWRPRILSNINKIDFMEKSIFRRRIFSNNPNSASPIFIPWQCLLLYRPVTIMLPQRDLPFQRKERCYKASHRILNAFLDV